VDVPIRQDGELLKTQMFFSGEKYAPGPGLLFEEKLIEASAVDKSNFLTSGCFGHRKCYN
jgi:hypothetical protein